MIRERRERRRAQAIPDALRSIIYTCEPNDIPEYLPDMIQIPPRRRTAKSRFVYPEALGAFGVSLDDWKLFTRGFELSAGISWAQVAALFLLTLSFHMFTPILLVPLNTIVPLFDPTIILYYNIKKRNTRKRVEDGTIPAWNALWNQTYFGPKGLAVGFDLPGCIFKDATVVPKPHKMPWSKVWRGPPTPMSKKRMARRPRVTVAVIHNAEPEAGQIPDLDVRVPRFQRGE